jgi:hypothetical protein
MFPSDPGNRQLSDRLPAWMVEAKHRGEVLRALDRLRRTLWTEKLLPEARSRGGTGGGTPRVGDRSGMPVPHNHAVSA